ncbi:MAG TPA: WD40 repeat domain-containing serine/threonine-protein kinase [Ktedonobacteraceae bacterium]
MVASAHLNCSKCGTDNPTQAAFCFACGQSLQTAAGGLTISSSTKPLVPNHLLKERYQILDQVGKGGFGAVYTAADTLFGHRLVAVKEMDQSRLSPREIAEATEAFKREAHLLAGLRHPNIPGIYDYFGEAGRWYLVMEFIEGDTLEEHLLKSKGKYLPVEKVLDIGIQLCTVLGYLHTRKPSIIFRDLKPANVLLRSSGQICLIDFGIARHFKPGQSRDTTAFGSPGYAPPEQYGKTQTTPRADIYALGATLHQLLTGDDPTQTPFRFAPLQLRSQTTPVGLNTLITSMLEIDEKRRPASMHAIKLELENYAAQRTGKQAGMLQPGIMYVYPSPVVPRPSFPPSQLNAGSASVGSTLVVYHGHSKRARSVAWSPDGKQIVSASDDKTAQVWEAVTGDHLFTYAGHADGVNAVAWSPDGKLITSASSDATVQVWEAATGIYLFTYTGHADRVNSVAWSPDGKLIASASDDSTVHIWDATTGRNMFFSKNVYRGHSERVRALAWSPDGKCIASASDDKTVHIWNFASRKPTLIFQGHADGLRAVAWSPDGKYIASGAGSSNKYYADNTVCIWDTSSGNTIYIYHSHFDPMLDLAWSPDGQQIASASMDNSVSVWQAR